MTSDAKARLLAQMRRIGSFPHALQVQLALVPHILALAPASPDCTVAPLVDHGGPTIESGTVALVYVDNADSDGGAFSDFVGALVTSCYYTRPDGADTTPSRSAGIFGLTWGGSGVITDAEIQTLLTEQAGGDVPANDGQTLYVIVLPPGVQVQMADGSRSCEQLCAYHDVFTLGGEPCYYAVIPDQNCPGCHPNVTAQQARQMATSHEYGEWRSDPQGNAWYSDDGLENGDECDHVPVPWGPEKEWTVQPLATLYNGSWVCLSMDVAPPS